MSKRLIFLYVFCIHGIILFSQSGISGDPLQRLRNLNSSSSRITIHLDSLIEANYYKHILFNQKNPGAMGYQIRIFSGSGPKAKEEAEKARSLFLSKFEDIEAYLVYDTPDYKVYVGDCRTQSERLILYNRVRVNFPNAFPVNRRINVTYD
jgi:hypothetical protein